jgi:hypothetical protein
MNDPHVEALIYHIEHAEDVTFDRAQPVELERPEFTGRIADGTARFAFKVHYSNVKEARAAIEPFIRVWETWDALRPELSGFRLIYSTSDVVDRNRPPGNYASLELGPVRISAKGAGVEMTAYRTYPEPPTEQATMDADVETLVYRYWLYRHGRDNLAAMAYFCLTVIEGSNGTQAARRKRAAQRYNVDKKILNKLGDLTNSKGGREARKAKGMGREFTSRERGWIESTVGSLVRRAAWLAEDPDRKFGRIDGSNLP